MVGRSTGVVASGNALVLGADVVGAREGPLVRIEPIEGFDAGLSGVLPMGCCLDGVAFIGICRFVGDWLGLVLVTEVPDGACVKEGEVYCGSLH